MEPFYYLWFAFVLIILSCLLLAALWSPADLLAFLNVMFSCVFYTSRYSVLGQVWYLIVSNPDLCLLIYFPEYFDGFCK